MEALQKLESEGLVESRPRVGTRVRVPAPQDIRDQYVLREALETQAARLFCEKASADEKSELVKVAEQVDELQSQLSNSADHPEELLYASHKLHARLHLRIAECTGCRALIEAVKLNQTLVFKWLHDTKWQRPELPARWHAILLEELCGSDPDSADVAMRRHVRHGREHVLASLEPIFSDNSISFESRGRSSVRNGIQKAR
jgi:DNA-binding GntR family transcriptional regulator